MSAKIILQKKSQKISTTQEMCKCRYDTNRTRSCELKQHSHKCTEKNVRKYFFLFLKNFKMADK